MTAVLSPQRRPMMAVPAATSGQHHAPPIAAMRTPASRQWDAPIPAAMTDSSAVTAVPTAYQPPMTVATSARGHAKVQFWVFRPRWIGSGARTRV
jgi:hypothetical protein